MSSPALSFDRELWAKLSDRFFFENRPATGVIVSTIMLWYLFQVVVLVWGWDPAVVQWVFTTESFPELSPGLFLAVISHAFYPQLTHVFGNVASLWLFAGESEQHMRQGEVIGFFLVTGLAAVLGGTAMSGSNTLGASGGALAFIGFYGTHQFLSHHDDLQLDPWKYGLHSPRVYWHLVIVSAPAAFLLYSAGQLAGVFPAGQIDIFGHLIGISLGTGYAVVREVVGS